MANKPKTVRGSLADALSTVLEYRNRPDSAPDPLASGWATNPTAVTTDGAFDDDDLPVKLPEDRSIDVAPSVAEIMRQVAAGPVVRKGDGKNAPIVAIGSLRFSDGTQREQAVQRTETGVETYMRRMPAGAMLGTVEKFGDVKGGAGKPAVIVIGNSNLADRLGVPQRGYVPGVRKRRKGRSYSRMQSATMLAAAIANTPVMPAVTVCPPGVASGTSRFSDQFIGMKIGSTGKGGAANWTDQFTAGRDHDDWVAAVSALEPQHAKVLSAAMRAKSFGDIVPGGTSRGARKRGRRLLIAANDNLAVARANLAA